MSHIVTISCDVTLFLIFATLYLTVLLYLLHLQLYVIGHICDLIYCDVTLFLVFAILHCTVWLYIMMLLDVFATLTLHNYLTLSHYDFHGFISHICSFTSHNVTTVYLAM